MFCFILWEPGADSCDSCDSSQGLVGTAKMPFHLSTYEVGHHGEPLGWIQANQTSGRDAFLLRSCNCFTSEPVTFLLYILLRLQLHETSATSPGCSFKALIGSRWWPVAGRLPSAAWCVGQAIEGAAADAQGRNPKSLLWLPVVFFCFGGADGCILYHIL